MNATLLTIQNKKTEPESSLFSKNVPMTHIRSHEKVSNMA